MKLLKKISIAMALMLSVTTFYGCKSNSPSDTVKTYLDGIKNADEKTISTLLDEVEKENEDTQSNSYKKVVSEIQKITYTINSESVDGDKATVNVKINGPDIAGVVAQSIQKMFTSALSQAFSGTEMTEEEQNKLYDDIMLECLNEVKFTDRTGDITLEKSDNEWKITDENEMIKLIMNIDPATFDPANTNTEN